MQRCDLPVGTDQFHGGHRAICFFGAATRDCSGGFRLRMRNVASAYVMVSLATHRQEMRKMILPAFHVLLSTYSGKRVVFD
ncbi:MAG: hypothetical protein CMM07_24015 [Rhodopirellula sp.]|nr:hypothetical protein [Rhodopirellula sp.]